MPDNDLIRRGDALAAMNELWITADNDRDEGYDEGVGASLEAIAALPAAPLDAPKHLTDALDAALKGYTSGVDRAVRWVSIDQVDMLAEFYLSQRKDRG